MFLCVCHIILFPQLLLSHAIISTTCESEKLFPSAVEFYSVSLGHYFPCCHVFCPLATPDVVFFTLDVTWT